MCRVLCSEKRQFQGKTQIKAVPKNMNVAVLRVLGCVVDGEFRVLRMWRGLSHPGCKPWIVPQQLRVYLLFSQVCFGFLIVTRYGLRQRVIASQRRFIIILDPQESSWRQRKIDWKEADDEPRMVLDKHFFLSVYVDEIKMAGRKQNMAPTWKKTDETA